MVAWLVRHSWIHTGGEAAQFVTKVTRWKRACRSIILSTDRSNYTLALSVTELSNFLENCTDTWWYTQERGLISAISLWPAPQSQEGSPMSACSVPWGSLVPSSWKHTCKHLQKSILTIEISVSTFSDTTMFLNCMRKSLGVAILQLERISDKTSQSSTMFSSALLLN